jgi:hypothetical protein
MKKLKFFQIFWLLILFSAILAGCGGGGGGGGNGNIPPSTIKFLMPGSYDNMDDMDDKGYPIPTDTKVQFYTLTEVIDESAEVKADHVFTGTTGNREINCTLPDHLKNQRRYILAVVDIGNTSFDPRGEAFKHTKDAAKNGEILFGQTSKLVTLTSGGTISNIKFMGKAKGEPVKNIYFTMPDTYLSGESQVPIPNDKDVTFYCVTGPISNTFSTDAHMFTGTTSQDKIKDTLPESLVGPSCYFYAVVNLWMK